MGQHPFRQGERVEIVIEKETRFYHTCDVCGARERMGNAKGSVFDKGLGTAFFLFGKTNIAHDGSLDLHGFFQHLRGDGSGAAVQTARLKECGRVVCEACYNRLLGYLKIIDTHDGSEKEAKA